MWSTQSEKIIKQYKKERVNFLINKYYRSIFNEL